MALIIVSNGTPVEIPENDYSINIAGGTQLEEIRVVNSDNPNGVTVWQIQKASIAKNAPPFLSAGWTVYCKKQNEPDYSEFNGRYEWIFENEIRARYVMMDYTTNFIFSSPIISTQSFSSFTFNYEVDTDDDTSEGTAWEYDQPNVRFSNDKINWTPWQASNQSNKSYKYAQVGIAWTLYSDSAIEMWFEILIHSVTFHQ